MINDKGYNTLVSALGYPVYVSCHAVYVDGVL